MQGKKADIIIDTKLCKVCGICVEFCPVNNLFIDERKIVEKGVCSGCGMCEERCPDFAITIRLLHGQEAATR